MPDFSGGVMVLLYVLNSRLIFSKGILNFLLLGILGSFSFSCDLLLVTNKAAVSVWKGHGEFSGK